MFGVEGLRSGLQVLVLGFKGLGVEGSRLGIEAAGQQPGITEG